MRDQPTNRSLPADHFRFLDDRRQSSRSLGSWGRIVAALILIALAGAVGSRAERVSNTTLRLPQQPPVSGFTTEPAFGNMTFTNPVTITTSPGETNRIFVVEQRGTVALITNLAVPNRTEFLNIIPRVVGGVPNNEQGLLGLAFHPGYATNGWFYVYFTHNTTSTNLNGSINNGRHQCLSRYTVSAASPHAADPNSERRILTMYDEAGNHNGGCLQFGTDGYLYVSTGDEGGQNDSLDNSQRIDKDLWSGILRIDVDVRPESLMPTPHPAQRHVGWGGVVNYRVPADNPYVGVSQFNGLRINTNALRTEFWAVGLRNPWRFSFDPLDGTLYCGDVGQGTWEEINVIVRGGNYGWAYREGNASGPKAGQAPAGFSSIAPIVAYQHGSGTSQGFSVTGGVMYRGLRFPSLSGKYVFADYVSGHIWASTPNGNNPVPFERLTTDQGIAGFGWDPRNGDVLLADQSQDTLKRLVTSTNLTGPSTLADTGAFADLTTLTPNPGIVPYDLNLPFWSDNAQKTRWFSVPNTNLTIDFAREARWTFPTGTVWIKQFDLELTKGVPASARRLETRFIVKNSSGVYGITYRWGDSLDNAVLVPEEGMDEAFVINDGGILRTQIWHYPGRGECLSCHTDSGGGALGFNTWQLNREADCGSAATNQIQCLSDRGYFTAPVTNMHLLRSLAHPTNEAASLEWRVRSYLEANCVFCHQPDGTIGSWDARFSTPTASANLIEGMLANDWGDPDNRVIAPGAPEDSMILTRINTRGAGAMPPLASSLIDTSAVALLTRWITTDLANYQSFADWQTSHFGSPDDPEAGPEDDPDLDRAWNYLEFLTGTGPLAPDDAWRVQIAQEPDQVVILIPQVANRLVEVQWSPGVTAGGWTPLNVPPNRPFYPVTNFLHRVPDSTHGESRFYRVRVGEL